MICPKIKKPRRILISIADKTEIPAIYPEGQVSIFNLLPFRLVLVLNRENWKRDEKGQKKIICALFHAAIKNFFYWDPFPLHINILNQTKLFTRKMKTKDSFTRQKTRFQGFLGNPPKAVKIKLWLERRWRACCEVMHGVQKICEPSGKF